MSTRSPLRPGPRSVASPHTGHEADVAGSVRHDVRRIGRVPEEGLPEYSLRLSQQVVSLEAQNLELQDGKVAALASWQALAEKVEALERENRVLRDTSFATFHEGQHAVHRAGDQVKEKQGEVMLLRHKSKQQLERMEALATDNARLGGIAERLQGERRQLQHQVMGWEATTSALQAEMGEQAAAGAEFGRRRGEMERRIQLLAAEKQRSDEWAGERHVVEAQLRVARDEFAAERGRSAVLRDELAASSREAAEARADAHGLAAARDALHADALRWRHAEGAAAVSHAALHGALQHHGATASGLRGRIEELEDVAAGLRRELTRLGAEAGSLRGECRAARAEAGRRAEEAAEFAGQRDAAEREAKSQGHEVAVARQRLSALAADVSELRRQRETLHGENGRLWAEVRRLEAENIILRSHARGREAWHG